MVFEIVRYKVLFVFGLENVESIKYQIHQRFSLEKITLDDLRFYNPIPDGEFLILPIKSSLYSIADYILSKDIISIQLLSYASVFRVN